MSKFENYLNEEIEENQEELKIDEQDTKEKTKTSTFLLMLKVFFVPIIIIVVMTTLFFINLARQSNFKAKFISPTDQVIGNLTSKTFVLSTYVSNNEESIKFVKTLKKLESKYDIPYYLIDLNEYPKFASENDITKIPAYFVFEKNQILYTSYGVKTVDAFYNEINNVKKYGKPINTLGNVFTIKDDDEKSLYTIAIKEVMGHETTDNSFDITIELENKSSEKNIEVDLSSFTVYSDTWDESKSGIKFNTTFKSGTVVDVETKKRVKITFAGETPYYQIYIKYMDNFSWTYKAWPNE